MKTINEILKLIKKDFEDSKIPYAKLSAYGGLCSCIRFLGGTKEILTKKEKEKIYDYLIKNRPKRVNKANSDPEQKYYWKPGAYQCRINWLNKHIKLTENKPIIKFNGGIGAILCNKCSVIIKQNLTKEEFKGKTDLLLCDKCKKTKTN